MTKIDFPALDAVVEPYHASPETLRLLSHRRSVTAAMLTEPGPDEKSLDAIIQTASRVPDHRKVVPFRFIKIGTDQRSAFADLVVSAAQRRDDEPSKLPDEALRGLAARGAALVVLVSSVRPTHKTPVWEQELTAGAVGMKLLIAASASGFAGQWLTEWMAYDEHIALALGLGDNERVAGFFYFGTAKAPPKERLRPSAEIISSWPGSKS